MQRTAEKRDIAADRPAAGQTGDGLIHHCLKDGGGEIGRRGALVDERLNVGFGKDSAACGNGVDLGRLFRGAIESLRVGLEQSGHLVDEGACAPGAYAVHPFLRGAGEVDDLGILPAELDGDIRSGKARAQRGSDSDDLLHEGNLQSPGEAKRAGSGDPGEKHAVADLLPGIREQICKRLTGVSTMTPVFFKHAFTGFVEEHELYCSGADVDTGVAELHKESPSDHMVAKGK